MSTRQEKLAGIIKELAASYIGAASNQSALITVTDTAVSADMKRATIFVTVLPEDKEDAALNFIKRNLGDVREHIEKHARLKLLPYLDVRIDRGEKERQKIDRLLRE